MCIVITEIFILNQDKKDTEIPNGDEYENVDYLLTEYEQNQEEGPSNNHSSEPIIKESSVLVQVSYCIKGCYL